MRNSATVIKPLRNRMSSPARRGALGGLMPRGGPGGRDGSSISAGLRGRMPPRRKGGCCLEGGKVLKVRSRSPTKPFPPGARYYRTEPRANYGESAKPVSYTHLTLPTNREV